MENHGFDVDALINAQVEAGLGDEAELESEEGVEEEHEEVEEEEVEEEYEQVEEEYEQVEDEEEMDRPDEIPTWSRAERRVRPSPTPGPSISRLDQQEWNRQPLERQELGQQEDLPWSLWTRLYNAIARINRALLSFFFLGIPKIWNAVGSFISYYPITSGIFLVSIAIASCIQYQVQNLYGPQSIASNSASNIFTPRINSIVNSLVPLYLPSNHKDVEHLAEEFHLMRNNTESCYAPWNIPDKIPLKLPQPDKINEQYCLDNWIVYVSRRHKSSRSLNLQIQDQRSLCMFLNCLGDIFNPFSRDLEEGRNQVKPFIPGFLNNLNRGARDALGWTTRRKVSLAVIKEQRITGWEKVVYQNKDMTLSECLKGVVDDALSWDIHFRQLRAETKKRWRELTRDTYQDGPCERNTT
ncbi:hypothetical protein EG328_004047 [Venturia inaequalis]|uniref:Uncharacterized protein n=1 Tax=Venturia inaequalis TaxID=5025 RepID=A0A8H3YY75_VENIN|nr:hypothetical protein EG328_004047 [Venturia inaequalis]